MTGTIVSLLIGLTIGALGAVAFTCCAFSEEIARKEELEALVESYEQTSIRLPDLVKILRSEVISEKRRDKIASSWNGALQAVRWSAEEYLGIEHHESL